MCVIVASAPGYYKTLMRQQNHVYIICHPIRYTLHKQVFDTGDRRSARLTLRCNDKLAFDKYVGGTQLEEVLVAVLMFEGLGF